MPTRKATHPQSVGLDALATDFPWPDAKPDAPISSWAWGIAGKEMLRSFIPADADVILEIGTLLGGSARFFASTFPNAHLICVDPWRDITNSKERPFLRHAPELSDFVTGRIDGLYQIFLASNWQFRQRLIPVRGFSPDMLAPVHAHGIAPTAIYVDGSHAYEDVLCDIVTAHAMFPKAILCGDDWSWPGVRFAVKYFNQSRGFKVHTEGNTWLIEASRNMNRHPVESARPIRRPASDQ